MKLLAATVMAMRLSIAAPCVTGSSVEQHDKHTAQSRNQGHTMCDLIERVSV